MKYTSLLAHLAAVAIVSILVAFTYAAVQQAHRSSADDPQLQVARDISNKLKRGETINKWFDGDSLEISQSLGVFHILYNDKKEPVLSTGLLNGKMPFLPLGVFDYAEKNG